LEWMGTTPHTTVRWQRAPPHLRGCDRGRGGAGMGMGEHLEEEDEEGGAALGDGGDGVCDAGGGRPSADDVPSPRANVGGGVGVFHKYIQEGSMQPFTRSMEGVRPHNASTRPSLCARTHQGHGRSIRSKHGAGVRHPSADGRPAALGQEGVHDGDARRGQAPSPCLVLGRGPASVVCWRPDPLPGGM